MDVLPSGKVFVTCLFPYIEVNRDVVRLECPETDLGVYSRDGGRSSAIDGLSGDRF